MVDDLLLARRGGSMLDHYWEVTSVNLLSREERDTPLAEHLARTAIDMCEHVGRGALSTQSAKAVLRIILKNYFAECWPTLGQALMHKRPGFLIGHLLGMGSEKDKEPTDALLNDVPQEALLQWCRDNTPEGPAAIAYVVPIFATIKPPAWHPLAKRLIDEFGQSSEVLSRLSANMFCFSSWGSRAPYYERRIQLFGELLDHTEPSVRTWAHDETKHYEKERTMALQKAAEWEWGIH